MKTLPTVRLADASNAAGLPGLWDGSTENKTVVRSLLADLVARGLAVDDGLLVVIDGAKALSAAVREVFGAKATIQRCTLHKRRNLADHLPDKEQAWVDAKLVKAFAHPDPDAGLRNAKHLAAQLDKKYPSAAASLREGLEEMFTVARLGIDGRLAKTLTTSNPVESMISIARATNRNVTRWRDGQMVLRWTAAGMLNAERSFRRIKGHQQMPQLATALHRHAHPKTAQDWASPGIVEASLCCGRLVCSKSLVLDRRHQCSGAVSASVVVEVLAPGHHNLACVGFGGEVVPGQDLVFEGREERLRSGVIET